MVHHLIGSAVLKSSFLVALGFISETIDALRWLADLPTGLFFPHGSSSHRAFLPTGLLFPHGFSHTRPEDCPGSMSLPRANSPRRSFQELFFPRTTSLDFNTVDQDSDNSGITVR